MGYAFVEGLIIGLIIGLLVMHHASWRREQDRRKMQRAALREEVRREHAAR